MKANLKLTAVFEEAEEGGYILFHKEEKNNLARKICRDLEIPSPENFQ